MAVSRCVRPRSSVSHSAGGDDARHEVERKDPLGALLVAVDREGDALGEKGLVGLHLQLAELIGRRAAQHLVRAGGSARAPRPSGRTSRRRRGAGRSRQTGPRVVVGRPVQGRRIVAISTLVSASHGEGTNLSQQAASRHGNRCGRLLAQPVEQERGHGTRTGGTRPIFEGSSPDNHVGQREQARQY